jgi:hypothetical protein
MTKLTVADVDKTLHARPQVDQPTPDRRRPAPPLRYDRETQALLDHLERSPAPHVPRWRPSVIPLDNSLLACLARWLRNLSLKGPRT